MAIVALVLNALVWGCSWWPLRELEHHGLHALWSSAATYVLGAVCIVLIQPGVLREYAQHKALWVLSVAAGTTMVGFNWGVTIAEVIRVVLLFYLMPVWSILIARLVLKEPITWGALIRMGLALVGAVAVLSPEGQIGFPMPSNLGEWLGLMGGAAFALNNCMLKHQEQRTANARLFGMFVGGVVLPSAVALALGAWGGESMSALVLPSSISINGMLILLAFAVSLLLANYGLQYGATRLPANVTSVVMLSEIIFATLSAIWLAGEVLSTQVAVGGLLIVMAAVLSAVHD